MKNFASYISKETMKNIIKAHETGLGNAIPEKILAELNSLNLGRGTYLPNIQASDEALQFIDEFITDVKTFKNTGEGSNYASEFVENN